MITAQQLAAGLRAFANALDGQDSPAVSPASAQTIGLAQAPLANAALGVAQAPVQPVQTPPPANVTSEQIIELISPHLGNEAVKTALGDTMRAMGIGGLPEAQPHQYPSLFQAFQGVIARMTGGGQPQPSPAPASII